MKYSCTLILLTCFFFPANAQPEPSLNKTFFQLDSLSKSNSIAKHFGGLYLDLLKSVDAQISAADSSIKIPVRRFEAVFANFFIAAITDTGNLKLSEWAAYVKHPNLQPIQYKLLGANTHLNADLWKALTNSFSKEEMHRLKYQFRIFKKSLNKIYHEVYREAVANNRRLSNVDALTFGMDRWVGNLYLYKWRKRQMRIAQLYWNHSPRFSKLLARVERKKNYIDGLILKTL